MPFMEQHITSPSSLDTVLTDAEERLCAWCLAEQGIQPESSDSHSICRFHANQVIEAQKRRAERRSNGGKP